MAGDRIEDLRRVQFAIERRGGYDRGQVEAYLTELADWLESDEAKAQLAQREIGLVSDRTRAILSAAQESADETVAQARTESESLRAQAERDSVEKRNAADEYATETRTAADADAKATREEAEAEAAKSRSEADEHARLTIAEADGRLHQAALQAEERIAGVDAEVAELAGKRGELVANLEQMVAGVRATIDGPGSEDLGLPDRSRTAAAFAEDEAVESETDEEPGDEPVAEAPAARDDAVTRVEHVEEHPLVEPDAAEPTRPYTPDFDTDEDLLDDARPPKPLATEDGAERRRRAAAADDDPETDEQKMTELL